jgi:group I intron endonuclease
MTGGVYTIRVQDSDKFYIGRTKSFTKRKAQHVWLLRRNKHHCQHLQNAFNKHGSIQFVEEQEENDKQKRIELEQEWIDRHKNTGLLFNVHMKASFDDAGDKPWSEKRARVAHNKGKPSLLRGVKRDSRVAKKISETKREKGQTEKQLIALVENRKKMDFKKSRRPMSESARKHLSELRSGVKRGPYSKAHGLAVSKARKGIAFSEEHKAKLREAALRRYAK